LDAFFEALDRSLPDVFAGPRIYELTGGVFTWSGIRTRRSRKQIPEECFGPRVGPNSPTPIVKEPFLQWVAALAHPGKTPSSIATSRAARG
jgi:hypothetical protein